MENPKQHIEIYESQNIQWAIETCYPTNFTKTNTQ